MKFSTTKRVCGLSCLLAIICSPLVIGWTVAPPQSQPGVVQNTYAGDTKSSAYGFYTANKTATSAGASVRCKDNKITVYFSPHGGAEAAYVAVIGEAKKSIRGEAYSFTSAPISTALIAAKKRGVDVQLVVDPSGAKANSAKGADCVKAGIPVFVDHKHAIMHAKVLILDGAKVATGSFNFSAQAENSNAENALVIECEQLAEIYLQNWTEHCSHSDPLK